MNDFNLPIYTAMLGGALIVIQSILMLSVGTYRAKMKKGVGVDGDIKMERLVRRHGNMTESAPIFIAILAIYEIVFGQTQFVFWIAIIFGSARLFHIIGFSSAAGSHMIDATGSKTLFIAARAMGATFTALSSIALGATLLYGISGM